MGTFNEINNNRQKEILQNKLQNYLENNKLSIQDNLVKLETDNNRLSDFIVPSKAIQLKRAEAVIPLLLAFNSDEFGVHKHAFNQLVVKLGLPTQFINTLITGEDWQKDLGYKILNDYIGNTERERFLIRSVGNEIRGILSDSYRRLNSMEILKAYLQACQRKGAILVNAHYDLTRIYLETIYPQIFEVTTEKNGVVYFAFGSRIKNSDFGDGALEVSTFKLVVQCLNGMVGKSMLKQVHLGKRLSDDIRLSEETYKLDTLTMASAVNDIVSSIYNRNTIEQEKIRIARASAVDVDYEDVIERLPKYGVVRSEADAIRMILLQNNPENGLQGSATLWNFAQAMTAYARDLNNTRRQELNEIADNLLDLK